MKDWLNAENLFSGITDLEEDFLAQAIYIDDEKKLKALRSKKKPLIFRPLFLKIAAVILCFTIVAASVIFGKINKNNISNYTGNNVFSSKNNSLENEKSSSSKESSSSKKSDSSKSQKSSSSSKRQETFSSSEEENCYTSYYYDEYDEPYYEYYPEESSSSQPEANYYIDSIDKLNFYAVKKTIEECGAVLPVSKSKAVAAKPLGGKLKPAEILPLSKSTVFYEIDRNTVFNITMEIYFTIILNDPNGFLAKKLGGTGEVEVVVTENNLDNMITFKRGDKYYSCLWNSGGLSQGPTERRVSFSSHKFISGYNVVKNLGEPTIRFNLLFNNSKIVGFNVSGGVAEENVIPDNVTFVEDFCVVMYVKRNFTIEQLEKIFN